MTNGLEIIRLFSPSSAHWGTQAPSGIRDFATKRAGYERARKIKTDDRTSGGLPASHQNPPASQVLGGFFYAKPLNLYCIRHVPTLSTIQYKK